MPSTPPVGLVPALTDAARYALRAPSLFNTQPWRWRVGADGLELFADRSRQLTVTDPDGRLLTVSCGVALHHARVALGAAGYRAEVVRFPEPGRTDLLARVRVVGRQEPDPRDVLLRAAIPHRHTDRRAFGAAPVPAAVLARLGAAAEAHGAHLHVVRIDQLPMLAVATARAAASELADPGYRTELIRWTNRPPWSGDGVPAPTAVRQAPRRVPVRDFAVGGEPGLDVGPGDDAGAAYAVLFGDADDTAGWLSAGEALSAVLLTAVIEGVSAAPLSDAIEVQWSRTLIRDLLPGVGHPFLVLRFGVGGNPDRLPAAPRRAPEEVIGYREEVVPDATEHRRGLGG